MCADSVCVQSAGRELVLGWGLPQAAPAGAGLRHWLWKGPGQCWLCPKSYFSACPPATQKLARATAPLPRPSFTPHCAALLLHRLCEVPLRQGFSGNGCAGGSEALPSWRGPSQPALSLSSSQGRLRSDRHRALPPGELLGTPSAGSCPSSSSRGWAGVRGAASASLRTTAVGLHSLYIALTHPPFVFT